MPHQAQHGYTLLELLIGIMVMGILASVAIPMLTQQVTQDSMAVRDEVRGLLRVAQRAAMTKNTEVCLVLQSAPAQMSLRYANAGVCSTQPLRDPSSGQPYGINAVPSGVALPDLSLRFTAAGRVATAASSISLPIGGLPPLVVQAETGFVD